MHGSDVYLAMEYVTLGDLENNVEARSGRLPESEAKTIGKQILVGLEIMHAESFAHRDLKPQASYTGIKQATANLTARQNVLVVWGGPNWWVKLADFGLSKRLTDSTAFHTRAGTPPYMAPERLNFLSQQDYDEDYTDSVDIWALGCIVHRLVVGAIPFPHPKSLMKYCDDESLFPHDPLKSNGMSNEGSGFLRQVLAPHPGQRPSASQALQHSWFTSGTLLLSASSCV